MDTLLAFGAADQADGALWTSIGVATAGGGGAVLTRGGVGASEGQLLLVNSGALWVPVAGLLTGLTLDIDPENIARDVLVLNLVGLGLGAALCSAYDPYDVLKDEEDILFTGAGLTLVSTGGTYFGAAAVTDRFGVNEAQASMFSASVFWAVLNGASGAVVADSGLRGGPWSTLVGGWTGQALGALSAAHANRTAGQVSLMNSGGVWLGAKALLVLKALGVREGYALWGTVAADAGLLTGYALATYTASGRRMSRARARWLDLGALAGGLAPPAALFRVWGPEDNERAWYLSAIAVGVPVGLGVAWHLTRDMDAGAPAAAAGDAAPLMLPLVSGAF